MMSKPIDGAGAANPSRRHVVKAGLAAAGAAAGSGAITGFPTLWAQNIKDIVIQHAGPPVTAIGIIAEQASKDLGFTVKMQASENADLLNRFLTQSSAIDVADISLPFLKYLVGRNVLQSMPRAKLVNFEKTFPLFSKGVYPDGREASPQGIAPFGVIYSTDADAKSFAKGETEWMNGIPAVTNADTLGIRPDLTGRPVNSWADLLDPVFKGKAALQDQPTVGTIDVAMAVEARGDVKYANKGNMTKAEIDKTMAIMQEVKRSGQFRSFWTTFDQSVNLMASGEVVIQSMWSPAVSAVRTRGIACTFQPLKEGYRGWGYVLGMMKHVSGLKRDCALEYANWYGSGFQGAVIAREGYYSTQPENVKKFLSPAEWDYWYDGKPATEVLNDPFGKPAIKPGEVRDGGSFLQRMGNIAVWNSVMDEDRYLTRKWNEFITS
jgi:putative spermidine/putrescine transport system substrate-binding protein